jgi:hypothetical protein
VRLSDLETAALYLVMHGGRVKMDSVKRIFLRIHLLLSQLKWKSELAGRRGFRDAQRSSEDY